MEKKEKNKMFYLGIILVCGKVAKVVCIDCSHIPYPTITNILHSYGVVIKTKIHIGTTLLSKLQALFGFLQGFFVLFCFFIVLLLFF